MFTENTAHYFLGANTPDGFYSLYDELINTPLADNLYIIKGGPGCGKSTFMKTIASRVNGGVEYIHCSGDPDSLDAVILKNHRLAYVDGTNPHVLEPNFPAAREQYLSFAHLYDSDAVSRHADTISSLTLSYKRAYQSSYRFISAAGQLRREFQENVCTPYAVAKAEKRAVGIIRREIPRKGSGTGLVRRRFLSSLTCKGEITLWDTVTTNFRRVFQLQDNSGLGHYLLAPIAAALKKACFDIVLCPCHWDPSRIRHLLIPELSLAFVTSTSSDPYPAPAYRRIRVDAINTSAQRSSKEVKKLLRSLTEQSISALNSAKALHDQLEAAYRPYVNFSLADDLASDHIARLTP